MSKSMIETFRQKYLYDETKPIFTVSPMKNVRNSYFKAINSYNQQNILISYYQQPHYEKLVYKANRFQRLKKITHQNIAKIYDVVLLEDKKQIALALQWCEGGSLYDYQHSENTLDWRLALKILQQISLGLSQIHKQNQIHKYLNMENIQFDANGNAKITYKCLYPKTIYISPQQKIGNKSQIKEGDIFSLGVLMYKIIKGASPFGGNNLDQELKSIQQGVKFPKNENQMFPICIPSNMKQLITKITAFKSEERLSCEQILQQLYKITAKNKTLPIPQSCFENLQQKYIPVFCKKNQEERKLILVLLPSEKRILRVQMVTGSERLLKFYCSNVLEKYNKMTSASGFHPLIKFEIINKCLLIFTPYDNQSSLKQYCDNGGTIRSPKVGQDSMELILKNRLLIYKQSHNKLTFENILIRKGQFFICYPPFQTKGDKRIMQMTKDQIDMIAPQIKRGQKSHCADAWSLGILSFFRENQQMPSFDRNRQLVIPHHLRKKQKYNEYYNYIKQDPKERQLITGKRHIQTKLDQQIPVVKKNFKKKPENIRKQQGGQKIKKQAQGPSPFQILKDKFSILYSLQKHWTKPIRVGLKIFLGLIIQIFLFYLSFYLINGQLITEHSLYEPCTIEIRAFASDSVPNINYTLVTKSSVVAYENFYNQTLTVLRDEYKCVLNDYSVQSDVASIINQSGFTCYQIFGILFTIFNMILFCLAISKFDFPKAYHLVRNRPDDQHPEQFWNWMYINLCIASQFSLVYLLYGSLFHMTLEPCLSKATLTAVQFLLKNWQFSFAIRYSWMFIGLIISYTVQIILIIRPSTKIHKYIKILLILLYIGGAFSRIMGGSGGYIAWKKQSVFGKLGEILLLIMSFIFMIIDTIFGCALQKNEGTLQKKKSINNKIVDQSVGQINFTENNFLDD